ADCLLVSWAFPDAVACVLLARMLRLPLFIKVHGSDINMHCTYPARAAQVSWALRQAAGIICVSRDLAQQVIKLGAPEEKVKVIYNGVDKSIFSPIERRDARQTLNLADDRRIILYIGNL